MNFDAENFKAWNDLVKQFGDAYCYNEFLIALRSAKAISEVGKDIAEKNENIKSQYHLLFPAIEASLNYSLTLSVCHFFDLPSERRKEELRSIPFFLNQLNDKMKKKEFGLLKKNNMDTIDKLRYARNNFFAHRTVDRVTMPCLLQNRKLLDDLNKFINSIGYRQAPARWNNINGIKKDFNNLLVDLIYNKAK